MAEPVRTAVVLAAGLGSRLGPLKGDKPKAFVEIGGVSLIERSIRLLLENGIGKIIIGTGYVSGQFDGLAGIYPQVVTVKNPIYDKTGSLYTLYVLREHLNGPFLLLEGDLLYEPAALRHLLDDEGENIILASDATHSGDEVFIQSGKDGLLEMMDKDKSKLAQVSGELVGISKLSTKVLGAMATYAERQYAGNNYHVHYEDALVAIANATALKVKVVKDMAWCEIDDPSHYERAVSVVYPKILQRS
ncbi:MAG: phosphocholine cytidylyltransferase family protein [Cyclobacteriaceae bacterium]|nr:phosphocholine cytidylyltransferase family protein [Cyclobacteriaceae bacterium]MCB0500421.1 phosphocholine cytidylyltransferase family protein [Cyclobacteriaceae bacterium]MCB9236764.1 phosphocholine cytidylyltransferase family protein [Flammeovirgaceae bacterium]MCO5272351.1 phosphocholine cytidylyltransferase family protein [Cyclobacteriaceae bacterium]MCW5902043.1 phosphocholine cytidylyltransferase family protein [Cyclobacteriaceae bacterium]